MAMDLVQLKTLFPPMATSGVTRMRMDSATTVASQPAMIALTLLEIRHLAAKAVATLMAMHGRMIPMRSLTTQPSGQTKTAMDLVTNQRVILQMTVLKFLAHPTVIPTAAPTTISMDLATQVMPIQTTRANGQTPMAMATATTHLVSMATTAH